MSSVMHLGPKLVIPNIATETQGVIGKRGMGKSTYGVICVEELLDNKTQVVVLDPTGGWWGLRASADGDPKGGYPIPIFGGLHADLPLEDTGGAVLAEYVVENRLACVLDLSLFSKSAMRRFVRDFCERFYLLKNQRRDPCHVVIDECDLFVPQRVDSPDMLPLVGSINDLVLRGRIRGIGVTLISQRPARINKDVLTQIEILVAFRLTGPQDIHAFAEWIEHNGTKDDQKRVLASLSGMSRGTGWFWAPGLMDGMLRNIAFRDRRTYDSSRTPDGKKIKAPTTLADVDLGALSAAMKATVEKAKADDPKILRRRITELERDLSAKPAVEVAVSRVCVDVPVDVPLVTKKEWDDLDRTTNELVRLQDELKDTRGRIEDKAEKIYSCIDAIRERVTFWRNIDHHTSPAGTPGRRHKEVTHAGATSNGALHRRSEPHQGGGNRPDGLLAKMKGARVTLTAIAQSTPAGATREQLTQLTAYRRSSRDTFLQKLLAAGFITRAGDAFVITPEGGNALGGFEPLPTGDALRRYWLDRLKGGEQRVLEVVCKAFPKCIAKIDIDAVTGYRRSSRDTFIQKLKARQLIQESGRGEIVAAPALFD